MDDYELPITTRTLLFAYYEQRGNYARAEDTLFDLLETDNEVRQTSSLRRRGQAFYTRLRTKSDADLLNGNFSREEVEEGIIQLGQA